MKRLTTLLATTAMACFAASAALAEKWDMPMAYPATNLHSENGAAFAKCVGDGSGGKLQIVTHPGGSLFAGNDIKRAVQTGQAPIGERLISAHANENPLFGIDSIPFLATSFEQSDKLWNAARPKMEELLASQNLVYVYAVPWPPQGLYVKKEVNSVADLKGVKFRAYNAATARIAELAGMAPVQIEAADLSQALATGVAESFISSGSTGVDSKVWESLTHFYDVQAWLPRNVVFANKDAFEALDEATRKVVMDCGDKTAKEGTAKSQEQSAGYLKTLADNGMKVSAPGDQLKKELAGFGETMTEEWIKAAGPDGKAIIDAYKGN
ncbi:TRAP transporter substrate-binding protein [Ollibium composti]|uniref:C4-dicarboxylate ABC transporter substrate-binding protein n=1 Tax=Ollibium composti TaxID=2675109 RepID=A0ABY2Q1P5_9HYPH|nr:TRAP transporter substrate-binding protein [Mesorhizobium composti]THF54809.1 C4-dicarboxylate ABC transporter substrate-binding protein [Mesorhizobium composti]